jgi:hypothetical protein
MRSHDVCLCVFFQLQKQSTDFHETKYEHFAIGSNPNVLRSKCMQSAITLRWMCETERWALHLIYGLEIM